jgi:mannitol/fructose-specific phosphotransferase system IIA component (Ntr-type)
MESPSILADYTARELVVLPLRGIDAQSALGELVDAMTRAGRLADPRGFLDAVLARERLGSSELAPAMAFPHARVPGLERVVFAFGRSEVPLSWGDCLGARVEMVFLMAIPEDAAAQYLSVLSGLARLSRDAALMNRLREAADIKAVLDVFRAIALRVG